MGLGPGDFFKPVPGLVATYDAPAANTMNSDDFAGQEDFTDVLTGGRPTTSYGCLVPSTTTELCVAQEAGRKTLTKKARRHKQTLILTCILVLEVQQVCLA